MGLPAESPVVMRSREGVALAAVIFGIVVISLITAGTFALTDLDTKATANREDAATALRLAHSAETHALSLFRTKLNDTTINHLLRGNNNTSGNADDGLFINFPGLGDSLDIPAAGRPAQGGSYFARILDDPNDGDADPFTDTNWRFIVRCAGETPRGSRSVIEFVVRYMPPLPAIAFNGNTVMQGNPSAQGTCGDIHTNGNVTVSGTITVNSELTTYGTVSGSGVVENAGGVSVGVQTVPVQIPIPVMAAADYCATADWILQPDGLIRNRVSTLALPAASLALGWSRTVAPPNKVEWTSTSSIATGSYCVEGSATMSGGPGPIAVSVFATGSIEISGNPKLHPKHASGVLLLADGDLVLSGNTSSTFNGIVYGGSQCRSSGNLNLTGQYLCQGGPTPALAKEIVASNLIEGNPNFNYSCTWAVPNDKYRITSWYQRVDM